MHQQTQTRERFNRFTSVQRQYGPLNRSPRVKVELDRFNRFTSVHRFMDRFTYAVARSKATAVPIGTEPIGGTDKKEI